MRQLRPFVFFVPFLLLLACTLFSFIAPQEFFAGAKAVNDGILNHLDWLFSYGTFAFLVLLGITYFLPIVKVRIGGREAKPMLSRWQWFSVTLCTTIATGILFWGTAEPMYHAYAGLEGVGDTQTFAMSTLFMHWTITPYGIYTLAGLVFALGFYNMKQPFSVATMLYPLFGDRAYGWLGRIADAICLFSLVAGMAASLGAGILSLSGGIERFTGWESGRSLYGIIGLLIVLAFVISSATGLKKGIRFLSDWNIRIFMGIALFVLVAGPTGDLLSISGKGTIDYVKNFLPRSLGLDDRLREDWVRSWTVFYWANWLAWTPVTALFLGRIAVGYTVREFIHFNLLLPALFGACWMGIFGGTTLSFEQAYDGAMHRALVEGGPQAIVYELLGKLPYSLLISCLMLFAIFISYVTAADSNTSAMTGMSVRGISPETQEAPLAMKVTWGALVGLVSWVMISFAGVDGVKMISNLGGLPALLLLLLVGAGLVRLWSMEDIQK